MQKIIVFVKVLFSAKVRQALALISQNRLDDGHELLKSSVMSQRHGLNARSAMVHFYVSQQQIKVAKEFAVSTLKDHDGSHDPYSLCAAAWVFFNIARENRDPQGPLSGGNTLYELPRHTNVLYTMIQNVLSLHRA